MLKKYQKIHSLPEFALGQLNANIGGGLDKNLRRPWNLIHSPPCRTPCRLFIHEVFFGHVGPLLRVWSELGRSPPFQPMRALRLPWSRAFSLVCEVGPSILSISWAYRLLVPFQRWALYVRMTLSGGETFVRTPIYEMVNHIITQNNISKSRSSTLVL